MRPTPHSPVTEVMTAPVATIDHAADLQHAAEVLAVNEIGALVVLEGDSLVGVLSERDVVAHVALGTDLGHLLVGEVMQSEVLTTSPATTIEDCASAMVEADVRHLPVRDGEVVVGMVSVRDLLPVLTAGLTEGREALT